MVPQRAKTKKAIAKRIKITGTGKIMFRQAGKRHLLSSKSVKRKRSLSRDKLMFAGDVRRIQAHIDLIKKL